MLRILLVLALGFFHEAHMLNEISKTGQKIRGIITFCFFHGALATTSSFANEQLITSSAEGANSVYATDLNGDLFVDILVTSLNDGKVRLFLNDGNVDSPSFTEQLITSSADGVYSVYATDLNGDSFVGILVASFSDGKVRLFLNDGNVNSPSFTEQLVTSSADGAFSVYATDLNGDSFTAPLELQVDGKQTFDGIVEVILLHVFLFVGLIGKRHTTGHLKRVPAGPGKVLLLVAVVALLFMPTTSAIQQIGDPLKKSGAVSTLERSSPVDSKTSVMRIGSTQSSTYQWKGGDGPISVINKAGSFKALQQHAFYKAPPNSSAVVAPRLLQSSPVHPDGTTIISNGASYTFNGSNVAAATAGSVAFASGSLSGFCTDTGAGKATGAAQAAATGIHCYKNVNDGLFGNSQSWIGDGGSGTQFVGIAFTSPRTIQGFAIGRNQLGQGFDDLWSGTKTFEVTGPGLGVGNLGATHQTTSWTQVGATFTMTSMGRHVYSFSQSITDVTGVRVKTTLYKACIDELEVYDGCCYQPEPSAVPTPVPLPDTTPFPTPIPTPIPTPVPTTPLPSVLPTSLPSSISTSVPTPLPTPLPSNLPTLLPTLLPTPCVDTVPFCATLLSYCASSFCPACPSSHMCDRTCDFCADPHPSPQPSKLPAPLPTTQPPSSLPTEPPSPEPTGQPTHDPILQPSNKPTPIPSNEPTAQPTQQPTSFFTFFPSPFPTLVCAAPNYMFRVEMFAEGTFASGQGGWGALSFGIYTVDGTGATELPAKTTGTLDEGNFGAAFACLPDDCYAFEVKGSPDPAWDTSWAVLETAGQRVIIGARSTRSTFCTKDGLIVSAPTLLPTQSQVPSLGPTPKPTLHPVPNPTVQPTMLPTPRPTRRPTPYPSNVPSLVPSLAPTPSPSPMPTELPTLLPTPPSTVLPTNGLGVLALDEAAVVAVAAATVAAVGAAVGGSIGGSVGGSVGGGSAGGGGGGGAAGNPLMLVFLVQGIFMTSKLSEAPAAYADVTGGLGVFNLQMAPPSWAKEFVFGPGRRLESSSFWNFETYFQDDVDAAISDTAYGFGIFNLEMSLPSWAKEFVNGKSGRRLKRKGGGKSQSSNNRDSRDGNDESESGDDDPGKDGTSKGGFFNTNSEAAQKISAHTFYLCTVVGLVCVVHLVIYIVFFFKNTEVPGIISAPAVEIELFLALFMGMLDVSAQVLMSDTAASGWKMIALIEICSISCFVLFLVKKGWEFTRVTHWEPEANVRRLRSDKFDSLDSNQDNQITLDELVKGAPRLGLTVLQATILFQRLDVDKSGEIDRAELAVGFKDELVCLELTTPMERVWGFFVEPRRSAGEYTAIDPQTTDIENPWVALFTDYSPSHVHFLSLNIVIMVVEAFAFAALRGWQQGVFLSLFSFAVAVAVVVSPPSVLLAQSRADTIDAFGRFFTFAIYSLVFPNWLNPSDAAQAMIVVNGFMLLHSIFTQLEPVVELALVMVGGVGMFLGISTSSTKECAAEEDKEGEEDEQGKKPEITSLSGFATTEEAVALVWQCLQTHHRTEGSIPPDFYLGLKKIAGASSGSTIPKSSQEDKKVNIIVLDQAAFDSMLAPLKLDGMTVAVAEMFVNQASSATGELVTVAYLNQMLNDGRLSRLERASRSLSIDTETSKVLGHPSHLKPKLSRDLSRSLSTDTETSEVLNRPSHLKSKSSRALSRSASINTEASKVLDHPSHLKPKPSRASSRSVSIDTEVTSKPGHALSSPPSNSKKTKKKGPEIELV